MVLHRSSLPWHHWIELVHLGGTISTFQNLFSLSGMEECSQLFPRTHTHMAIRTSMETRFLIKENCIISVFIIFHLLFLPTQLHMCHFHAVLYSFTMSRKQGENTVCQRQGKCSLNTLACGIFWLYKVPERIFEIKWKICFNVYMNFYSIVIFLC